LASERRIIPISSGKGGVGKTTVALNYALSLARHDRTVLIDLDTGTSSIRNCLDTPVERDLYHFFKKGHSLADCVTPLRSTLDPEGHFRSFGFIAAPKHLIEDITNFTPARRAQLIDAINALDVRYVVLDLKSGLDSNVIEFLPYSNSGVLVFTPHLPAATLAASDIVKAILFRKLRVIFAPGSSVYNDLRGIGPDFVNSLIDRVEDVYDSSVHNLDVFASDLRHALGEHPVVSYVTSAVDSFMVYFVLNRFNGIQDSYETAVKPFVTNLAENVGAHITVFNLGWVVDHPEINSSNIMRVPVLLTPEANATPPTPAGHFAELERIATQYRPARAHRHSKHGSAPKPDPTRYLDVQLETLRRMFDDQKGAGYRENFRYITARSLFAMKSRRTSEFGDTRIFQRSEIEGVFPPRRG
jgi:MinD-like ATPase involved in chromosome partitioning or flagellar assembly